MASRAEVLGLVTIGGLALAGCVGEGKRPEPPPPDQPKTLEVDETATALALPSETPSPFPTLTPTPTETLIPAVATGMKLPGVVRVERPGYKWIGFDAEGHPIWQSRFAAGNEWERFERELKIICEGKSYGVSVCDLLTPEMLEPIDESLVKPIQFVDAEGQIVEVEDGLFPGLDIEEYGEDGELRSQSRAVAGVIRGYVPQPFRAGYRNAGTPQSEPIIEYQTWLYIEVRLNEFASQGMFYPIPDKYTNLNIFFLKALDPELGPNGEVSYDHIPLSHKQVTELFIDNESAWINQQVIFKIRTYAYYDDEQTLRNQALIMEALESGKPTDLDFLWAPTELYVPSELVP